MRLLPVIDLKETSVVRGIAGHRDTYQPIRSRIASDPSPAAVARAFVQNGFVDVYVADLGAIGGAEPDWKSYEQIADEGLNLIIDAGIAADVRIRRLADFRRQTKRKIDIVAAGESVVEAKQLREVIEVHGEESAIFSLDLRNAQPITARRDWQAALPFEIVVEIVELGFQRLIVLDLAAVGCDAGPATLDLCRQVRAAFPGIEIISGGGVRNDQDVDLLCDAGCDRVLVASALHDGRIRAR